MSTKEQSSRITKFARQGKLEGDGGVRQLLLEGAKMKLDMDFNEKPYFRSALWEATWRGHEAIVKLLMDSGSTISFADYQGRTPLHEAAFYGHLNLVVLFIEKGHPLDVIDNFGQTPIFRAAEGQRHDVVKVLVKAKAQCNIVDTDGVTVQHCAAFTGLPAMSDWLLYQGSWKHRYMSDDHAKRKGGDQAPQDDSKKDASLGAGAEADEAEAAKEEAV